ncbi:hypothetical protein L209DRAFT_530303 [Thermothelomyces heterothallicus CBS 203.75]
MKLAAPTSCSAQPRRRPLRICLAGTPSVSRAQATCILLSCSLPPPPEPITQSPRAHTLTSSVKHDGRPGRTRLPRLDQTICRSGPERAAEAGGPHDGRGRVDPAAHGSGRGQDRGRPGPGTRHAVPEYQRKPQSGSTGLTGRQNLLRVHDIRLRGREPRSYVGHSGMEREHT